jgi:hypothetical protein
LADVDYFSNYQNLAVIPTLFIQSQKVALPKLNQIESDFDSTDFENPERFPDSEWVSRRLDSSQS